MTQAEQDLAEDRATRDAARALFQERLAHVRRSLGERSIPARVADEAKDRAKAAAGETVVVASDYRWVVAATVAALVAWLLRRPLIDGGRRLLQRTGAKRWFGLEPASSWERCRNWIERKLDL